MNRQLVYTGGGAFESIKALHGQRLMALLAALLLVVQGCGGSEGQLQEVESTPVVAAPTEPETPFEVELQNPTQFAVTVTAAADFSSGAHTVIEVVPPCQARNNLVPTVSYLSAACQGRFFLPHRAVSEG